MKSLFLTGMFLMGLTATVNAEDKVLPTDCHEVACQQVGLLVSFFEEDEEIPAEITDWVYNNAYNDCMGN